MTSPWKVGLISVVLCGAGFSLYRFLSPQPLAVRNCEMALSQVSPHSPRAVMQQGTHLGEQGNPLSALEAYTAALQEDPGDAWIYASRAYLLSTMGQPQAALQDTDLALDYSPDYAWAHSHRGAMLLQLHHPQAALISLNQALDLLRSDQEQAQGCRGLRPYTHLLRARTYHQLGNPQAAVGDYQQAIRLYRRYHLRDLQDYQRALEELQHLQEQQATPVIL